MEGFEGGAVDTGIVTPLQKSVVEKRRGGDRRKMSLRVWLILCWRFKRKLLNSIGEVS